MNWVVSPDIAQWVINLHYFTEDNGKVGQDISHVLNSWITTKRYRN